MVTGCDGCVVCTWLVMSFQHAAVSQPSPLETVRMALGAAYVSQSTAATSATGKSQHTVWCLDLGLLSLSTYVTTDGSIQHLPKSGREHTNKCLEYKYIYS